MEFKRKISDWYKEKIEGERSSPPVEAWENIENRLDIDQVWDKVSKRLDTINLFSKIKRITYYSVAAISLLLFIDYLVSNRSANEITDEPPFSSEKPKDKPGEVKPFNAERNETRLDTMLTGHQKIEGAPAATGIRESEKHPPGFRIPEVESHSVAADSFPEEPSYRETTSPQIPAPTGSEGVITPVAAIDEKPFAGPGSGPFELSPFIHPDLAPDPGRSSMFFRGFYFGLSLHIRNTWLLNNTTFGGLTRTDLTSTVPDFGKSVLFLTGTNLSKRITLQFEGAVIDEGGQKYFQYIHGKYVSRAINLDYLTINLLLKYRRTPIWAARIPVTGNYILGTYAGYLKFASEITDAEIENITRDYSRMDFGIITGYEYDFHLGKRYILSSGIRFNLGFPNVFAGNDLIPSTFNKTRNASANFVLGVKYLIPGN